MNEKKDLLYFISEITESHNFWAVNYYLRSMKKAPHGGVFKFNHPNTFLKHYRFDPWTLVTHNPESIPYFMSELIDEFTKLFLECPEIDWEELLQYCFNNNHNDWFTGLKLLHVKKEYEELNKRMSGVLLWNIIDNNQKISCFFDIEPKYAIYALILCLIQEKMIEINGLDDILRHERLRESSNRYGLSKLSNINFLRQGFCIDETYYLYNIFLDTSIELPGDTMPFTMKIITDEILDADIFMRCDDNLSVPFDKMISTATFDFQKSHGITLNFANIESLIQHKEIVVHIHPELFHKVILIIKPDQEENDAFYHIEVEQLWNPDVIKDDIVITNYVHAKYYPSIHNFKHIDFSVNQYDIETYKAKYLEMVNDSGIPIDKHGDQHYKVWCVEANNIAVDTWSKLVASTLDEPFREIFFETFKINN